MKEWKSTGARCPSTANKNVRGLCREYDRKGRWRWKEPVCRKTVKSVVKARRPNKRGTNHSTKIKEVSTVSKNV